MELPSEKRINKVSSLQELLFPEQKITEGSDVELTEEERAAILEEARKKKAELVKYEQDKERRRLWEAELRRPWEPKDLAVYVQWKAEKKGIRFEIDADCHNAFKALCRYFTGHESFEKMGEGWSLQKGIMLCGPVGTGKTTLMGLFRSNQRQSFKMIPCSDLADRFAEEGHEVIQVWSKLISVPSHMDTFFQKEIGVCFDDLGEEKSKKNFGNEANVMADILKKRYDFGLPFQFTHATTNLSGNEIEEYYGTRVRSRMREMFNMITLTGGDRRK